MLGWRLLTVPMADRAHAARLRRPPSFYPAGGSSLEELFQFPVTTLHTLCQGATGAARAARRASAAVNAYRRVESREFNRCSLKVVSVRFSVASHAVH